jgi:hypothetical protein
MKPSRIAFAALVIATVATTAAIAQSNQPPSPPASAPLATEATPMHHPMGMQAGMRPMAGMRGHEGMGGMMAHAAGQQSGIPMEPGQAAFGAIQEIVGMLQADPHTDWSKVDVDALRQHLIDMDEVTMRATAKKEPIDNGLRIEVTGTGRTLEAIQRMVPEHARDIDGMSGWTVRTTALPDGVELTVTASNPADVQKIRGLGFMGIMVQGTHQMHHLAMAKGEMMMHTH